MFPAVRIEISVDGGEFTKHRARTVVVGNVGYLQAGMPLLPDASIDDGLLDVVILHPRKFLSWIPLAYRVLAKSARTDDTIDRMTARTVTLRAPGDTPRQLDGDSIGSGRELRMSASTGGCSSACPADAPVRPTPGHGRAVPTACSSSGESGCSEVQPVMLFA